MTDPGRLFLVNTLAVASFASLLAAPSAHAQKWLAWRSPATHGNDTTTARIATSAAQVTPRQARPVTVPPTEQQPPVATTRVLPAVITRAQASSTIAIEPLPSSTPKAVDTTVVVGNPEEAKVVVDATVASEPENACDEISRCNRLEVVRSGVGVEAPKDDAAKRKPENAAKRHVLQSVRSVW